MSGIALAPYYAGDGAAGVVDLGDDSINGTATAKWKLGADGYTYRNGYRGFTWLNPQNGMSDFEIRVDLEGGGDPLDINAGSGVWLAPALNPQWGYTGSGPARAGTLDVQIRQVSDGTVVDTASIALSIEGTTGGGGVPTFPPRGDRVDPVLV